MHLRRATKDFKNTENTHALFSIKYNITLLIRREISVPQMVSSQNPQSSIQTHTIINSKIKDTDINRSREIQITNDRKYECKCRVLITCYNFLSACALIQ